jgi:hypothetical protein
VVTDPSSSDRFNEDKATLTVRGSDAPDLEAGVAAIRNVVKTLPARPGVYRMQDAKGDVLYVGKAITDVIGVRRNRETESAARVLARPPKAGIH